MTKSYKSVEDYFTQDIPENEKEHSVGTLLNITKKYGSVVDHYPSWHPLNKMYYHERLDHTRYFLNAILTCPTNEYHSQDIISSVDALSKCSFANIQAERLDVKLYTINATPILISCDWKDIPCNSIIPAKLAVPLMLQEVLGGWETAYVKNKLVCWESWEDMRRYFLANNEDSSLFINKNTIKIMKKVWRLLNQTRMFGSKRCPRRKK